MLSILFAFGSAFGYGMNQLFNKKLVEKEGVVKAMLYSNLFLVLIGFLVVLFTQSFQMISAKTLITIIFAGLVGAIASFSLFVGLQKTKVALILSTANTFPIVALILSIMFLGITIKIHSIFFILVTILGVMLLSIDDFKHLKLNKFVVYGVITALGWGAFAFFTKLLQEQGVNPFATTIYIEIAITAWTALYCIIIKQKDCVSMTKNVFFFGFLSGLFTAIGTFFYSWAVFYNHPAIVATIVSTSPIITTVIAHFVLKERIALHQLVGIIIAVLGVILLSVI